MSDHDLYRRKFILHSAHETIGVSATQSALQACEMAEDLSRFEQPAGPLHVCLATDTSPDGLNEPWSVLQEYLEEHCQVICSRVFYEAESDCFDLDFLELFDCVVLRMGSRERAVQFMSNFMRSGRRAGMVMLLPQEDSPGRKPMRVAIARQVGSHSLLAGFEPFDSWGDRLASNDCVPAATVLLTGSNDSGSFPVAWVQSAPRRRILYTSLGCGEDFRQPGFLRLLANAVLFVGYASA
jgi:hypothetical protein